MPITAYLKDDMETQHHWAIGIHTTQIVTMLGTLVSEEYLDQLLDAYHVEKNDGVIALIKHIIEDAKTRTRKEADVPFEVYMDALPEDEEI